MAKRFIDTEIFRKPLVRGMKAPYKALFIYLLCECDHAGVWDVELDVAAMRLGFKMEPEKVIKELRGAVVEVADGKWWIPDFVTFQYGDLNPANRVHLSVINRLEKLGIDHEKNKPLIGENKPLISPLQGAKDKDKDKDTLNSEKKERAKKNDDPGLPFQSEGFRKAWEGYLAMRVNKRNAPTERAKALVLAKLLDMGEAKAIESLDASTVGGWTDVYQPKPKDLSSHASTLKSASADRKIPETWT